LAELHAYDDEQLSQVIVQISRESFPLTLLGQVQLVRERPQPFLRLHKFYGLEVHGLLQFAPPPLEVFLCLFASMNIECRTDKPDRLSFPVPFLKKDPTYSSYPYFPTVRPHDPVFHVVRTVSGGICRPLNGGYYA
jgi:hypothetical protein